MQSINVLAKCHPSLKTSFKSPYLDLRASTAHKEMPPADRQVELDQAEQHNRKLTSGSAREHSKHVTDHLNKDPFLLRKGRQHNPGSTQDTRHKYKS